MGIERELREGELRAARRKLLAIGCWLMAFLLIKPSAQTMLCIVCFIGGRLFVGRVLLFGEKLLLVEYY
jgi:hypothetical protein